MSIDRTNNIYTVLCEELKNPIYSTMSDAQAANHINSKMLVIREPIQVADVKAYSIQQGFFADIDEACDDADPTKRKLCKNVRAWIDDAAGKLHTIDIDSQAAGIMLEGLVAYELMTRQQANEVKSMANKVKRWVDIQSIGSVGEGHVKSARELNHGVA